MEKKQTHIAYGFITGIIMVAVSLILYLTGLMFKNSSMAYVSLLPFCVFICQYMRISRNSTCFSEPTW